MFKRYVMYLSVRERILRRFREALNDETGATVAEYALVLVLVTIAVIGVLTQLGVTLEGKINNIIDSLGG